VLEGVIVSASLFVVAWSIGLRGLYAASGLSGLPFAMSVAGLTSTVFVYLITRGTFDDDALLLRLGLRHVPDRCGGLAYQPEAVVVVRPPRPPSRVALWLPYLPVPFAAVFGTIDL
jgi:hypothetical protein